MNIIIRNAVKPDFPAIIALIEEFSIFQQTPDKMHMSLDQLIADEAHFQCLVAEVDGVLVGYAAYFFTYYSWTGRGIYLDDLYVREGSRKYGIGKQLLFGVIGLAKDGGCKSVRWLVSRWNENAIEFYQRIGAEIHDTEMTCVLSLTPGE